MDKLAIVAGVTLLWMAWQDKTDEAYKTAEAVIGQEGFIGTVTIMGVLLMIDQYASKKVSWIPATIAAIIALSYFNKFDENGDNP